MNPASIFSRSLRGASALLLGSATIAWFFWPAARPVDAAAPPPPPAAVAVAPAVRDAIAPTTWVTGSVESRNDARVASELAGRVLWVAEIGARVASGEPLARLDEAPLRLQAVQDEAALARIDARLSLAQRQAERLDSLDGRSAVAQTQLDQVRSERDVLAAERAQAAAVLAQARRRVRAAVVRAPFAGIVVERAVQPGEFVQFGAAVARFVDIGDLEVRATAPLALAARLLPGLPVMVRAAGVEHAATLRALVPVGDSNSRQLELRVTLDAGDWMAGSAVEVALPADDPREALLVPRDALVLRGAESFVFRIGSDERAQRLLVRTGAARGDAVVVEGALDAGDRLVVRGAERLTDGQPVTVVAGS